MEPVVIHKTFFCHLSVRYVQYPAFRTFAKILIVKHLNKQQHENKHKIKRFDQFL